MDRGQRPVVTGIHRLQHVERFLAADLANDDAIGPHTEGVDDQLPLADGALAFDVRRTRLEPRDVLLLQLQLGGVLDRDDPLAIGDESGQDVEQRRLAGAGAAADQAVQPRADAVAEKVEHRLRQRLQRDQVFRLEPLGRKPADRQKRAVHGQRRDDRVDARSVGQPRVHHRRAVVDPAADAAHDPIDDPEQVAIVLEGRGHAFEDAGTLDEDVPMRVDQDVADARVAEQRLERPETEHVVQDLAEQRFTLGDVERRRFLRQQLAEQRADLRLGAGALGDRERFEVEPVEQLAVNGGPKLEVLLPRRGGANRPVCFRSRCGRRGELHWGLPDGCDPIESQRAARRDGAAAWDTSPAGIEQAPGESIELFRDAAVAGQRHRHAGVERRRNRAVIARERVVNRMPERAFNLRGRNRVRLRRAIQQQTDAIAARAELADALEQPLGVPHRRHVGVGDETDVVGGVERRHRAGSNVAARVDDDVLVLAPEQPEHFFETRNVLGARTLEVIRARHDVETGLVLDDQLAQELAVEPMEVVHRVEQREAAAHAEEQRHLAEAGIQVDDDGRALAETRQLDGAIHGKRRRSGAALRPEEHQRGGLARAPVTTAGAPRRAQWLPRTPTAPAARSGIRWRRRASPAG